MAQNPLGDFLTTFKNGTSKALRVVSENFITGGYSPANLTMQNAVTADGNGTLLNVNEYATAVLEVRGTFSATINFEGSIDDTNWYPVLATKNDGINGSTTTITGLYELKVATIKSVRARVSGFVSGSITVIGKVSPLVNAEKSMQLTGSIPVGSNEIGKVQISGDNAKTTIISTDTLLTASASYRSVVYTVKGKDLSVILSAAGSIQLQAYIRYMSPATTGGAGDNDFRAVPDELLCTTPTAPGAAPNGYSAATRISLKHDSFKIIVKNTAASDTYITGLAFVVYN